MLAAAAILSASHPDSLVGSANLPQPYTTPLTGWYVGFILGAIVVTIVVILVAVILRLARKIGEQAEQITLALNEGRINTVALWEVSKVNDGIRAVTRSAAEARALLEAQS